MHLLVIDDDPAVALMVKELLPDARVLAAKHGLEGMAHVRGFHSQLDLVILDIKMPYNGVNVAVRLRYEFPALRILPYSYSDDKAGLLRSMGGIAPLLIKPVHPDLLRQRIYEALALPPPGPLQATDALLHIRQEAIQQELEQQQRDNGAALFSNMGFARLLQPALAVTRQLWFIAFSRAQCSDLLGANAISVLLTDTGIQLAARELAAHYQIPMLVVAFTTADGCRALYASRNVVLWQEDSVRLVQALERIRLGQSYTDPIISERLNHSELNKTERAMLPFILQDASFAEISRALNITEETARKYRSHITTALRCPTIGELTEYLNRHDVP